jgi:phosphate transport system protein
MSIHLLREIEKLNKQLLSLCALVEDQVQSAVKAFLRRDAELAEKVSLGDVEIDRREIEVEEECLKVLALHQPVAVDLRKIISSLKINNDLERIGDMAVNIAHKAMAYSLEPPLENPFDIAGMWEKTQAMLHDSLDAMVDMNSQLAHDVCLRDDEVDRMKHEMRLGIEKSIIKEPGKVLPWLRVLAVSRNLERIADCACNIAEDVIYMVEGKIIRHGETR